MARNFIDYGNAVYFEGEEENKFIDSVFLKPY